MTRDAAAELRARAEKARADGLDCPDCGHPWADHDLADNRDDKGRVLTDTAPLIEVCTAGSGKELGPDDHPLEAACGCIRTYWPDPPYEPASRVREDDEARVGGLIGTPVRARTGDGPIIGVIDSIDSDGAVIRSGAWYEKVAWVCLAYPAEPAPPTLKGEDDA